MLVSIFLAALATALPSPAACVDTEVRTLDAAPVVYPESAKAMGMGEVVVDAEVTVDGSGRVASVRVVKPSGNLSIDQAVMRAARQSHYLAAVKNCQPVGGTVIFHGDAVPPPA